MAYGTNSVSVIKTDLEGNYSSSVANLHKEIDEEVDRMNRQGYKVVTVTPLTGSSYDDVENRSYGQSFTIGVIIVFEAIE